MFRYTPTEDIQCDLERFNEVAKRLDLVSTLPRTWSGRVRRDLESEAVRASVALEGVPVTVDEVRRILADDKPAEVSDETNALVRGYREAMQFVLRRADDPDFEWSSEIFRSVHTSVMAHSWTAKAGLYRDRQVWLTNSGTGEQVFLPPPPEKVAQLVDELAGWLQRGSRDFDPLVTAALAHAWIAAVHPFRDGNGRTARIAASLVMYRSGFRLPQFTSLEEWWGGHPADYYAAFQCLGDEWDPEIDATAFVRAHVAAQRCQADALSLRYATERLLWTVLEDITVHELRMNPRATNALWDAFFGRSVTNRYYRSAADVPQVTAAHDLKQLQTSGMLAVNGAGRGTCYRGTLPLARRVVELLDLEVDLRGDAPVDDAVRDSILAALARKASCL